MAATVRRPKGGNIVRHPFIFHNLGQVKWVVAPLGLMSSTLFIDGESSTIEGKCRENRRLWQEAIRDI
jgi:hypothetical protein